MAADILIVDDEEDIRELVAGILEDEGHGARLARADERLRLDFGHRCGQIDHRAFTRHVP